MSRYSYPAEFACAGRYVNVQIPDLGHIDDSGLAKEQMDALYIIDGIDVGECLYFVCSGNIDDARKEAQKCVSGYLKECENIGIKPPPATPIKNLTPMFDNGKFEMINVDTEKFKEDVERKLAVLRRREESGRGVFKKSAADDKDIVR